MPKTLGRSLWIFALLVIAVLSWQWLEDGGTAILKDDNPIAMAKNQSDYYLEDFHILNVDNEHGQVYELTGKVLSHDSELGNSTIDNPIVQVFSKNNDHWKGDARSGNLSADFKILTLTGEVDLSHHQIAAAAPIVVEAESLTIDTDSLTMTTETPVTIRSQGWTFNAMHMRADVENGTLSFDSGVEAEYAVE